MATSTSELDETPDETPDDPQQAVADARRALQEAEAEARLAEMPTAASLLGLPDQLPLTWCALCKAEVKPYGKGICPRCHKFVKGSFAARKHPVNLLRRDVILGKLLADYQPTTTLLRSSCEMLASILEQLEVLKPGSTEHQRLVTLSKMLGETLEASRPAAQLAAPDRITEIRRVIVRPGGAVPPPPAASPPRRSDEDQSGASISDAPDPRPAPNSDRSETSSEAGSSAVHSCPYCGNRPCVSPTSESYRVLHWDDPVEVERRRADATATMLARIGKPHPWLNER